MARRDEAPLILTKKDAVDANGEKLRPETLRNDARHMLERARKTLVPTEFSTAFTFRKSDTVWREKNERRIGKELEAWRSDLSKNMLVAQELYMELWEHHLADELGKGFDPKAVFKLRRFKEMTRTPEDPSLGKAHLKDGGNAEHAWDFLFMTVTRRVIGDKLPSDKSDDYDAVFKELFKGAVEAVKEWEGAAAAQMYVRLYEKFASERLPAIR